MLENIMFFGGLILYYLSPLIIAFILIKIFRALSPQDSMSKDFVCGLIFLQATREIFKGLGKGFNRKR